MVLKLHEFGVGLDSDGNHRQQWSTVMVKLQDTEAETIHVVTATVLVKDESERSLGAVKQSAVDRALTILQAAQDLLREHGAIGLKELQWTQEDAEARRIAEETPAFLKGT